MSFRETFFNKIFTLRNLFFFFNFLVLALFLYALSLDWNREWKPYQKEYKTREHNKQPLEIKQILATDFNRVDRCITCHTGYDSFTNPTLTNGYKDHPYAAPQNAIHQKHPFEKYGCAVCHEGQGLATTFVDAAHMPKDENQKKEWEKKYHWEIVEFWEQPMKAGPLLYASCSKCHQAHPKVAGMESLKKGEKLVFENGCIGCHQIRGEGGTIAPDLAEETSVKPLTRIDFGPAINAGLISKKERTLENWIRLHFATAPQVLTPGDPEGHLSADPKHPQAVAPSGMPYFGFNKEETEALVAYVTSLKREKIPYIYYREAPPKYEPVFTDAAQHGRYVFQKYGCTGCHGKNANKGIPVFNRQGQRAPDLVKTVGTFTREELIKKIQTGVNPEEKENPQGPTPPLYMPTFKEKIKGTELEDLVTYLTSIAEKTEEW